MLEEHNYLILHPYVLKLKYIASMRENISLSNTAQNHSSVTILKHFVYRWQLISQT